MARNEKINIDGPVGQLEAQLDLPENDAGTDIALVLHPHPLHGGAMGNKVVVTVARAMNDAGIPALRFNFRGVGSSDGVHDQGIGEQADAAAAATWLAERYPDRRLRLAGFSFGGGTAIRVADTLNAAQLISCAAPAAYFVDGTPDVRCPWAAIHGIADEVASWEEAQHWLGQLPQQPTIISKAGVSHFFHGELGWLRQTVLGELGKLGNS